ncbi:SixA phosphatase family protein [Propioniciclava soli]|uniref:SixA phosphatase family protein n=1 Tax=Propioniciclava soli TaxID=2775081 RepID=UPI001E30515A|nr:histidine phosphatase family protein [Propioniciclava soli]
MRHAKSSWKTNDTDLDRPLSGRGTRDAVVAGQRLAGTRFDVVLLSPAARTSQTWDCLAMAGVHADDVRVTDDLYHAWTPQVIAVLNELPASAHKVLLIGHEPTASDLVLTLAGEDASPVRARIATKFPTCGVAVLTHDAAWEALAPGTADLVAFEVPRG